MIEELFPDLQIIQVHDTSIPSSTANKVDADVILKYAKNDEILLTVHVSKINQEKRPHLRVDVKKITFPRIDYIVTNQFYKAYNRPPIKINDYLIVTNVKINTPYKTLTYGPSYRINLEHLFSIPVRSIQTSFNNVRIDVSFYKRKNLNKSAYITIETTMKKYDTISSQRKHPRRNNALLDYEKKIIMYRIDDDVYVDYYDTLRPLPLNITSDSLLEEGVTATVPGSGTLSHFIKKIFSLLKK